VGMYVAGFHHFFIVTILATLTALVPVLGTWLIWGPFVLWIGFHDGRWGAAVLLTIYGSVFVGLLDNVIRAYVLHTNVKLHPLLAFVSVLGGIQVMGLWGIFIGPIVASCLHALIKIFNTEIVAFSEEKQARTLFDRESAEPLPKEAVAPLINRPSHDGGVADAVPSAAAPVAKISPADSPLTKPVPAAAPAGKP